MISESILFIEVVECNLPCCPTTNWQVWVFLIDPIQDFYSSDLNYIVHQTASQIMLLFSFKQLFNSSSQFVYRQKLTRYCFFAVTELFTMWDFLKKLARFVCPVEFKKNWPVLLSLFLSFLSCFTIKELTLPSCSQYLHQLMLKVQAGCPEEVGSSWWIGFQFAYGGVFKGKLYFFLLGRRANQC